jgi:hypothetical protein
MAQRSCSRGEITQEHGVMLIHFHDAADSSAVPDADGIRRLEQQSARRERLGVSIAVASLGLVALIWLGILGRVLWQPSAGDADVAASAGQCMAIADSHSRLDCYDREARNADPWPAKGARAPLLFQTSKATPQQR